jgi:hypothetical protein
MPFGEHSSLRRILLAIVLNGLSFAALQVAVAVLVGDRFGPSGVGILLGAGVFGRLCAPRLERVDGFGLGQRCASLAVTTTLLVGVLAVAPLPVLALLMAPVGCFAVLYSGALLSGIPSSIPAGSAANMIGQSVGMFAAGFLAASGALPVVVLVAVTALLHLLVPLFVSSPRSPAPVDQPASLAWLYPFLLATFSYGPLGLFAVLVSEEFGARWVGPAFLVYAVGSIVAARLAKTVHVSPATGALLAAAASLLWVVGFSSVVVMLSARLLSGVLLFLAQGSALRRAAESGGSAAVTSALVGLGVGASAGAFWCGFLAELSIPAMAIASAAFSVLLAVLCRLRPRVVLGSSS